MKRSDRGLAVAMALIAAVAVAILTAAVGLLLQAARRATVRLQREVRAVECREALRQAAAVVAAAGRPVLPDPYHGWTQAPPSGEDLVLEVREGGILRVLALRWVPADREAFAYLRDGSGDLCLGDRAGE